MEVCHGYNESLQKAITIETSQLNSNMKHPVPFYNLWWILSGTQEFYLVEIDQIISNYIFQTINK